MRWLVAVLALLLPQAAAAGPCRDMAFEGAAFTLCEVAAGQDLRLFHADQGSVLGSFSAVSRKLGLEGKQLAFAMNAGMYHADRSPVGLYVEDNAELAPVVTAAGPGNFGMLPNGVFCIGERFAVVESRRFAQQPPACRYATQSGPMLVIDGALHPRLIPDSDSLYIRNGVGVSADGQRAVFAISNVPVNFHHFARLFRDALGLPNALYFDGKISRLYAPDLRRNDIGFAMGPMVGFVIPKG